MSYLLYSFIYKTYIYGGLMLPCLCTALGIVILLKKDKCAKWLGAWFLARGLCDFVQHFYTLLPRYISSIDIKTYSALAFPKSCVTAVLSVFCFIAIFLYAKWRYSSKGLLATILLILAKPVAVIPLVLAQSFFMKSAGSAEKYAYLRYLASAIPEIAFWIFILVIYYKNREKEEKQRALWTLPLFILIFNVYFVIRYLLAIFDVNKYIMIDIYATIVQLVIITIYAFYVLSKAPNKLEETS